MRSNIPQQRITRPPIRNGNVDYSATEFLNRPVSEWSKFGDPVWILSKRYSIHWLSPPERRTQFSDSDYQALVETIKGLADILLNEEGLSACTVFSDVGSIKELAAWILSRPSPVKHFKDVTGSMLIDYVKEMSNWSPLRGKKHTSIGRNRRLGLDTIRGKISAISRLYYHRDRLEDGLRVMPVDLISHFSRVESGNEKPPRGSRTRPIPDEEHTELLGAAVDFINNNADHILEKFAAFIEDTELLQIAGVIERQAHNKSPLKVSQQSVQRIKGALRRFETGELNILPPNTSLSMSRLATEAEVPFDDCVVRITLSSRSNRAKILYWKLIKTSQPQFSKHVRSDLFYLLRLLQIACFIILATSTGMRLGELLALKPGCVVQKQLRGYDGTLFWLKSVLTKTSTNLRGEIAYWLCGELAAKAITILEKLHKLWPTAFKAKKKPKISVNDSLFRSYVWNRTTLIALPLAEVTLYKWTPEFIQNLKLSVGHVHPHQFRRTFARNVVRWSSAPILALQRHFKHWSLLMTDYYVGIDDQLFELYFAELRTDSRKRLRQIMAGECGGPGGLISQKRLAKLADNEELPLNFRGKEYLGGIDALVDEISEDGVVAYKCADFTTCLYVLGLAKCGEDGPKAHECHPTECANSYILIEDVPFYLHNIRQNLASLKHLSDLDREGPIGNFFLDRVRRDVTSIRPLLSLYAEKLQQLQNHYSKLGQAEKDSSYGVVLRSRIERDTSTLEYLMRGQHV